jgi:NTE family protein
VATAFVLSGGGSLGAVQAGMLRALAEHGVAPDVLVGTSVGAINAAWAAGSPGPDGARALAEAWLAIRRREVFRLRPASAMLALAGRRDHLVSPRGLRALLARHLTYSRVEEASVRLRLVATDVASGLEVVLSRGDVIDAVMASAAVPAIFPAVTIGEHQLVDGGLANNTAIAHAINEGATTVYVLPTGYACARARAPRSALGVAVQSIALLVHQRLAAEAQYYRDRVDLRVLPAPCPLSVSPIDFSHTAELIAWSYELSVRYLEATGRGEIPVTGLRLHRH